MHVTALPEHASLLPLSVGVSCGQSRFSCKTKNGKGVKLTGSCLNCVQAAFFYQAVKCHA